MNKIRENIRKHTFHSYFRTEKFVLCLNKSEAEKTHNCTALKKF